MTPPTPGLVWRGPFFGSLVLDVVACAYQPETSAAVRTPKILHAGLGTIACVIIVWYILIFHNPRVRWKRGFLLVAPAYRIPMTTYITKRTCRKKSPPCLTTCFARFNGLLVTQRNGRYSTCTKLVRALFRGTNH